MPQQLVNRARSSGVGEISNPPSSRLPDYEPLECPLDDKARDALKELSTNRKQGQYKANLDIGVANLGHSVSDLQERLYERRTHLARRKKQRKDKVTDEDVKNWEAVEEYLDDYARQVDENCRKAELILRRLIDQRAAYSDEDENLIDLCKQVIDAKNQEDARLRERQRQRQDAIEIARANGRATPEEENGDESESKPEPAQSLLDSFHRLQQVRQGMYEQINFYQRYAVNNEYAGFKKLWHDAAQGEDGPPLPDASRWFSADDEPVLPTVAPQTGEGRRRSRATAHPEANDSDDDIAVAREVTSLRCPLVLREFVEPYSNKKCKHTFEKEAILDYLTQKGRAQCPQTGCSQLFDRRDFDQDFYPDLAIMRRLQRKNTHNRLDNMDVEDEDTTMGSTSNGEIQESGQRRVRVEAKREK